MKPVALRDRPLLSIPETMRLLRWSRGKVETAISSGQFKSYRDGERVKVVTSSVIEHINSESKRIQDALQEAA